MSRTTPAGDFDYETGGRSYGQLRRTEPRIAELVHAALGDARRVVNVGAGSGSYEPRDPAVAVTAVEPSAVLRAQRPAQRPAVDGVAEALPFPDDAFDAAMAMVTVHQWADPEAGLAELRRVALGPVVVLTFDPAAMDRWWLADYAPAALASEGRRFPAIDRIRAALGPAATATPVPVPADCVDGFAEAYFGRPELLLDDEVRSAQSMWGFVDPAETAAGLARLRDDLASGAWDARHGALRAAPSFAGSLTLVTG